LPTRNEGAVVLARTTQQTEKFENVLAAAKGGANWAWAVIYGELAGPVTGYLSTRGATEPEDLCSETFLQVARGIHAFSGDRAAFRSWVFVIAHRRLLDARRAEIRRPTSIVAPETFNGIPGASRVDEDALARLSTDRLWHVFERLTDDQRDVLALRVIADLTLEQTAEVTGKQIGAVKALQRRALASLRRDLQSMDVPI
jgi:RNA polymerase sigma-70 factor (ECF subfamily)